MRFLVGNLFSTNQNFENPRHCCVIDLTRDSVFISTRYYTKPVTFTMSIEQSFGRTLDQLGRLLTIVIPPQFMGQVSRGSPNAS